MILLLYNSYKDNILSFMSYTLPLSILIYALCWWKYIRDLPPGPRAWPVIGCLSRVEHQHIFYKELTKRHGRIISAYFGIHLTVAISDYRIIRKIFRSKDFINRPDTNLMRILEGYGVINVNGKLWIDQRRFLHDSLRKFGMTYWGTNKLAMERRIMSKVGELITCLEESNGEPVDLNSLLAVTISNVICDILMSKKFAYNDEKFFRFMHLIDEGFRLFGTLQPVFWIPFLKYLPRYNNILQTLKENREELAKYFREAITEHRETFDPSNMRDLVDIYLDDIEKAKEDGSFHLLFEGKDADKQIEQILGDMFSAGMETIKVTLLWAILLMLHNPEHMKRVQDELDQVIGRGRLPKLDDEKSLPVTNSTIMEILRVSSIVPLGTTHSPVKETQIGGYRIPKGAHVIPLLQAIHTDPTLWTEPEKFNPSRFINDEGKIFTPEYFLPFGIGRRQCLGEILAKMELFLIFSTLMHTFQFSVPESTQLPNLTGIVGVTITPKPYKVCVVPRRLECDGSYKK